MVNVSKGAEPVKAQLGAKWERMGVKERDTHTLSLSLTFPYFHTLERGGARAGLNTYRLQRAEIRRKA